MHNKDKGTIGEISIVRDLLLQGYQVFTGVGDNCKVDLIVLDKYRPVKVQVKAITPQLNGSVNTYLKSSGPNYAYVYTPLEVDIFAFYVLEKDIIFYVSTKELALGGRKMNVFRLYPTVSGQKLKVRYVKDYRHFERALRDCTPNTLQGSTAGDEPVQTTTHARPEKSGVVGNLTVEGSSPSGPTTNTTEVVFVLP